MQEQVVSVADLVALVPYELGFQPVDSVVIVALRDVAGHLMCTMRVDLFPEPVRSTGVDDVAAMLAQHAPASVVVIGYGGADVEQQATMQAVALDVAGIPVPAGLVCADGSWRVIGSDEWHPVNPAARGVAEHIVAGRVPLVSRAAKVDQLSVLDPPAGYVAALGEAPAFDALTAARAWVQVLTGPGEVVELAATTLAVAVTALGTLEFRDVLLTKLAGFGPGDAWTFERAVLNPLAAACAGDKQPLLQRLLTLCRITPDTSAAPLCALAAAVAWVHDGTVLANEAVDRALTCDRSHRLARLLGFALSRGINPTHLQGEFVTGQPDV